MARFFASSTICAVRCMSLKWVISWSRRFPTVNSQPLSPCWVAPVAGASRHARQPQSCQRPQLTRVRVRSGSLACNFPQRRPFPSPTVCSVWNLNKFRLSGVRSSIDNKLKQQWDTIATALDPIATHHTCVNGQRNLEYLVWRDCCIAGVLALWERGLQALADTCNCHYGWCRNIVYNTSVRQVDEDNYGLSTNKFYSGSFIIMLEVSAKELNS